MTGAFSLQFGIRIDLGVRKHSSFFGFGLASVQRIGLNILVDYAWDKRSLLRYVLHEKFVVFIKAADEVRNVMVGGRQKSSSQLYRFEM